MSTLEADPTLHVMVFGTGEPLDGGPTNETLVEFTPETAANHGLAGEYVAALGQLALGRPGMSVAGFELRPMYYAHLREAWDFAREAARSRITESLGQNTLTVAVAAIEPVTADFFTPSEDPHEPGWRAWIKRQLQPPTPREVELGRFADWYGGVESLTAEVWLNEAFHRNDPNDSSVRLRAFVDHHPAVAEHARRLDPAIARRVEDPTHVSQLAELRHMRSDGSFDKTVPLAAEDLIKELTTS